MKKRNPTASEMGRRGAKARAGRMTAAERSASARKAALARWRKKETTKP